MQNAALAERFDDAGQELEAGGHRIIIRRARALVEAGDLDGAVAFLEEAGKRQRSTSIDSLAEALTEWAVGEGDVDALKTEPAWSRGRTREDHAAALIAEATTGDLATLTASLARQQAALAAQEPVEIPAVEPPVAATDAADVPAADVPAAAVEKPGDLEAREPDFEGDAAPSSGLSLDKPSTDAAPDEVPADAPPVDEAPADEGPAEPEAPADFGTDAADTAADVTPPERPAHDAASEGPAWGPILIVVGAAAAIAAYFLL